MLRVNNSFFKKTYVPALCVSTVLLFIALSLSPVKPKAFGDLTFFVEAKQISLWVKGEVPFETVSLAKAPLPSIFYAIPSIFTSGSDRNYWVASVLFSSLVCLVALYFLLRGVETIASRKAAWLTLALLAIMPLHVYYAFGIMAEFPAFAATCFVIYGVSKIPSRKGAIIFFVALAALICCRPNIVLVLPLLTILFLAFFYKYKQKWQLYYAGFSILTFVFIQFSFTMLTRLQKESLGGESQEHLLWYVVHQGRYQFRTEPLDWRFWQSNIRGDSRDYQNWRSSLDSIRKNDYDLTYTTKSIVQEYYIDDFVHNPLLKTRQVFIKMLYGNFFLINSKPASSFAFVTASGKFEYFAINLIVNLINIVFVIGFLISLWRFDKQDIRFWILYVAWFGIILFPALVYMEPRYLLPLRPIMILLTAWLLMNNRSKIKRDA